MLNGDFLQGEWTRREDVPEPSKRATDIEIVEVVWVRCPGCNYRYQGVAGGQNVGYNHEHDNSITGGIGRLVKEVVTHVGVCKHCDEDILRAKSGEWFHYTSGIVECDIETPHAEPWGHWEHNTIKHDDERRVNNST